MSSMTMLHWLSKINWLGVKEHEVGTVSLAWPGGQRSSNGSESGWVKKEGLGWYWYHGKSNKVLRVLDHSFLTNIWYSQSVSWWCSFGSMIFTPNSSLKVLIVSHIDRAQSGWIQVGMPTDQSIRNGWLENSRYIYPPLLFSFLTTLCQHCFLFQNFATLVGAKKKSSVIHSHKGFLWKNLSDLGEKNFWNCHIWTIGSNRLPKYSKILKFSYFPLWPVAKFDEFLLCGWLPLWLAPSKNWKRKPLNSTLLKKGKNKNKICLFHQFKIKKKTIFTYQVFKDYKSQQRKKVQYLGKHSMENMHKKLLQKGNGAHHLMLNLVHQTPEFMAWVSCQTDCFDLVLWDACDSTLCISSDV